MAAYSNCAYVEGGGGLTLFFLLKIELLSEIHLQ